MSQNKNPKLLIIISSPSGAGKPRFVKILENNKGISISISDTTRPARNNEVDGIDYNFISSIEFDERIKKSIY